MSSQPAKKFSAGLVSAAVWINKVVLDDGRTFNKSSVKVQRSYKDKEGRWGNTDYLELNDIPRAILVLQDTYRFLVEKKEEE